MPAIASILVLELVALLIGIFAAVPKTEHKALCCDVSLHATALIPESVLQKWNTQQIVLRSIDEQGRLASSSQANPSDFAVQSERARIAAQVFGDLADLPFREAFPLWLNSRTKIAEGTRVDYEKNFKRLEPSFGPLKLKDIHIGHIYAYREERRKVAGASRINHEISTVQQILKRTGLWEEISKWYEPLPLPKESSAIALTEEEERYYFKVAMQKSRWQTAYFAELLSRNTAAGPGEICHLRLKDIDLDGRVLHIHEGVKNNYRPRTVELNDVGYWAVCKLMERAFERGCEAPEHHLLPLRKPVNVHGFDPSRPMVSWKGAHNKIKQKVAEKFPRLAGFTINHWRHTAATVMLENPTLPYNVIERQLGHRLGSNTKEYYAHLRQRAMRAAAEALCSQQTTPMRIEPYGAPAWMKKVRAIRS